MKNLFKLFGVIALIAVIGFVFTACGDSTDDDSKGDDSTGGSGNNNNNNNSSIKAIEMVSIPAGTFMMGSPTSEPNRGSDETQHSVTLSAFSMSKYQVTQKQYQDVMGAGEDRTTASYGKGDNYPIYYVNWYDAIVFCNKLSIKEGLNPVYSINDRTNPADWGTVPFYDVVEKKSSAIARHGMR